MDTLYCQQTTSMILSSSVDPMMFCVETEQIRRGGPIFFQSQIFFHYEQKIRYILHGNPNLFLRHFNLYSTLKTAVYGELLFAPFRINICVAFFFSSVAFIMQSLSLSLSLSL